MKITLELTKEQVKALLSQLTPNTQPQTPSVLTDYSKKYLTIDGLQELAKTEYQQFTTQERTIADIKNRIIKKTLKISPEIDYLYTTKEPLKYKDPIKVANVLCNGNVRILVANNHLVRNGYDALTFEDSYIKALKNKGFMRDSVASCNSSLYSSILSDMPIKYTITTENKPSKFYDFITARPEQLIRAWTYKSKDIKGSMLDTHATMIYYTNGQTYSVDTASINRNTKTPIDIANLTHLHDRTIDHLEALDKP
jgi:hypothetical protein